MINRGKHWFFISYSEYLERWISNRHWWKPGRRRALTRTRCGLLLGCWPGWFDAEVDPLRSLRCSHWKTKDAPRASYCGLKYDWIWLVYWDRNNPCFFLQLCYVCEQLSNSGSFLLSKGQGGCGHCPNGSAPGSCESSSGRLGHAGAPLRWRMAWNGMDIRMIYVL